MHADSLGNDAAPALRGLDLGGEIEVGDPKGDAAGVFHDGALEDAEDAGLGGTGVGTADLETSAALGAETVHGTLPLDVGEEVGRLGAGGEDEMLKVGALGDEGTDFILFVGMLELSRLRDREVEEW